MIIMIRDGMHLSSKKYDGLNYYINHDNIKNTRNISFKLSKIKIIIAFYVPLFSFA